METVSIYIIITIAVTGICFLGFEQGLERLTRYHTLRKMLRLELTNDIVNTTILFDRLSSSHSFEPNSGGVQSSLLNRQISDRSKDNGSELILYIEKWLLFDARERKSTYTFYADRITYESSIHPQVQFDITLWIKELLNFKPHHIDLELSIIDNTLSLMVNEIIKEDVASTFDNYPKSKLWGHLSGKPHYTLDKVFVVDFTLPL